MILFLAIIMLIFFIIQLIAIVVFYETFEYEFKELSIFEKISRIFIMSEMMIIGLLVLLVIFYGISKKIVCDVTHNDYKGCKIQEEVQEQVMINE